MGSYLELASDSPVGLQWAANQEKFMEQAHLVGLEAQVDMEQDLAAMEGVQVVMEVVRAVLVDSEGLDLVALVMVLAE